MEQPIRDYLSNLGKKGFAATKKKYGVKQMRAWGRLGGRPRKRQNKGSKPGRQISTA